MGMGRQHQSWELARVDTLGAEHTPCCSSPAVHAAGCAIPAAALQAINENRLQAAEKNRDAQALQKEIDGLNAKKRQAEAERANIVSQCVGVRGALFSVWLFAGAALLAPLASRWGFERGDGCLLPGLLQLGCTLESCRPIAW